MGLVITINAYYDWELTFFVQSYDETEAKEKAYKMFRQSAGCYVPDTLEKAEQDECISISIVAKVDNVLL